MADRAVADQLCNGSSRGNLPEVLSLLHNGADVNGFNKYNRTALQVVMLGNSALVEAILVAGADPKVRDPACGLTVIHDAAREGFVDSVRVLLDHGADTNLVDGQGNLPLHLAAREGHLEVIRLMIGRTATPKAPNGVGLTPRELARLYGRFDTVDYIDMYLNSISAISRGGGGGKVTGGMWVNVKTDMMRDENHAQSGSERLIGIVKWLL